MKKTNKILIASNFCTVILTIILPSIVLAAGTIDTNYTIGATSAIHSSDAMIKKVLGYIQVIGSILAVVALMVIGFRYMISSVDEQSKIKGVIIYYVIGAVLVFTTSNIVGVAYKVITGLSY